MTVFAMPTFMYASLILVGVCIVIPWRAISGEQSSRNEWRHYDYPNPLHQPERCVPGRGSRDAKLYICDPDSVVMTYEVDQLNTRVLGISNGTKCPCSDHSCHSHREGYKVGIALVKNMKMDGNRDDNPYQSDGGSKMRKERNLHEAHRFAQSLLLQWKLGRCEEDVIIFFSVNDKVMYTVAGEVARMKLTSSLIIQISSDAQAYFKPGGSVIKGLFKMITEFREVFQGTYKRKPALKRSESKSAAGRGQGHVVAAILAAILPAFKMF